ncbi:unnamed protein product, partial [Rotaria sordida]
LVFTRDRYAQSQNQSNIQELKKENHFLKDYVHRLNAASSEYQTMHPPKTLRKEMNVCNHMLFNIFVRFTSHKSKKFLTQINSCRHISLILSK